MNVTQAQQETERLLAQHGLYQQGWRFSLGRGKSTLGTCYYRRKIIRISKFHIWHGNDTEVRETILHEIAHALVGESHGHDNVWEAKAREIGLANPQRCVTTTYTLSHHVEIECPNCGVIDKRHRRMCMQRLAASFCKGCGPKTKGLLTQVIFR